MGRNKILSIILKIFAIIIILIGIYVFIEYRLWNDRVNDFFVYLKTFLPILVLGFSGTLYGIAALLDNEK